MKPMFAITKKRYIILYYIIKLIIFIFKSLFRLINKLPMPAKCFLATTLSILLMVLIALDSKENPQIKIPKKGKMKVEMSRTKAQNNSKEETNLNTPKQTKGKLKIQLT